LTTSKEAFVDDSLVGDVYVIGSTSTDLFNTNAGANDVFVVKYSGIDGEVLWARQIGSGEDDIATHIDVDEDFNVFVVGKTNGDLNNTSNSTTGEDCFVAKYSADGTLQWVRQFGTSNTDVGSFSVGDSNGEVVVYGLTKQTGVWG